MNSDTFESGAAQSVIVSEVGIIQPHFCWQVHNVQGDYPSTDHSFRFLVCLIDPFEIGWLQQIRTFSCGTAISNNCFAYSTLRKITRLQLPGHAMADPLEISIENPCSASKKPISFSISDAWAYHKKEIVKLY